MHLSDWKIELDTRSRGPNNDREVTAIFNEVRQQITSVTPINKLDVFSSVKLVLFCSLVNYFSIPVCVQLGDEFTSFLFIPHHTKIYGQIQLHNFAEHVLVTDAGVKLADENKITVTIHIDMTSILLKKPDLFYGMEKTLSEIITTVQNEATLRGYVFQLKSSSK